VTKRFSCISVTARVLLQKIFEVIKSLWVEIDLCKNSESAATATVE
jgi:hypothetical protein